VSIPVNNSWWRGPTAIPGGSINITSKTDTVSERRYISWGIGTQMASAVVKHDGLNNSRNFYEQVAREAATEAYVKQFGPIDWPFASVVIGHHDESITVEIVVMKR